MLVRERGMWGLGDGGGGWVWKGTPGGGKGVLIG